MQIASQLLIGSARTAQTKSFRPDGKAAEKPHHYVVRDGQRFLGCGGAGRSAGARALHSSVRSKYRIGHAWIGGKAVVSACGPHALVAVGVGVECGHRTLRAGEERGYLVNDSRLE